MDERMKFALCREFGISRKTGYKIWNRYERVGLQGLTDRPRRPLRLANQLPQQIEKAILRVKHLKVDSGGLVLEGQWTKNGRDGFQHLPHWLAEKLVASTKGKDVEAPLLRLPKHPARAIRNDLAKAGIKNDCGGEKIDFHALRVTFVTFLLESGASVKEAQTLARHADPRLTMNVYARTRQERLAQVTEGVGRFVNRNGNSH